MRLLLATVVFLAAFSASAAKAGPFLVADVDPNADTCLYTAQGATTPVSSPVVVDNTRGVAANSFRICKIDLSGSPVGTNAIVLSVSSAATAALWGPSPNVPFSFARPVGPVAPSGTRLLP